MSEQVSSPLLQRLTALFGLLTVVYTVFLVTIFPSEADLSPGYFTPIIAFEFAQTPGDLAFLSGPAGESNRAMMDRGNSFDMFYPFLYGGLFALSLLQIAKSGRRTAWLGVLCAVLIIPADIYENLVLLAVTRALSSAQSPEALLPILHTATWTKWGLIAVTQLFLASFFLRHRWWVGGTLAALGGLTIAALWVSGTKPLLAELSGLMVGLMLLYLTVTSIRRAFRPAQNE